MELTLDVADPSYILFIKIYHDNMSYKWTLNKKLIGGHCIIT